MESKILDFNTAV